MPRPFHALRVAEFARLLEGYPFERRIDVVHMHHTWRPTHDQDRGLASVEAMWRFHTQELGWSDIAQHLTIDKRGVLWTGRDWNRPPASAAGFNGNSAVGPFMFEMIGDFDRGRDPFGGEQREAALMVIALVQRHFGLAPDALRFHNQMSPKSCPGSALDYDEIISAVRERHEQLARDEADDLFSHVDPAEPVLPFGPDALAVDEILADLNAALRPVDGARSTSRLDPADAELPEHYTTRQIALLTGEEPTRRRTEPVAVAGEAGRRGGVASSGHLTEGMLRSLRPHVVNLTWGQLSRTGRFQTRPDHVEAIFEEHLPRALQAARDLDAPLHLVFYAHGGLVPEEDGLAAAHQHVTWWKQTANVYPIYFVWETGLFRSLVQATKDALRFRTAARGEVFDRLIEQALQLGDIGERVWSAMKSSAALASMPPVGGAPGGGANLVAEHLATFVKHYHKAFKEREIQLHAIGHSAGAVFHNHFVPTALAAGVKRFETVQFMAPALRIDDFKLRLGNLIGRAEDGGVIDALTLYTMHEDLERADDCIGVYKKSLLYLIRNALEDERPTPILGLDESLRRDPTMARLFGLNGHPSDVASVVFSETRGTTGPSASRATAHGDFDNDAATMQSLYHRIVGAAPPHAFPQEARSRALSAPAPEVLDTAGFEVPPAARPTPATAPSVSAAPALSVPTVHVPSTGRRRALCIGIDAYPGRGRLFGCVNDARAWARTLERFGFAATLLLDDAATRDGLLDALDGFLADGRPGDVLALQYSGHGTQLDDASGDETTGKDQAFCPVDGLGDRGAIVLDDELRARFDRLDPAINLTTFFDCCHSGSITRFAFGTDPDRLPRLVNATEAMYAFRDELRHSGAPRRAARSQAAMRDVTFSATQSFQLAYENDGQGDFTRHALQVLAEQPAGRLTLTNEAFYQAVLSGFAGNTEQTPMLDAAPARAGHMLLAPYATGAEGTAPSQDPADTVPIDRRTLQALIEATQRLDAHLSRL